MPFANVCSILSLPVFLFVALSGFASEVGPIRVSAPMQKFEGVAYRRLVYRIPKTHDLYSLTKNPLPKDAQGPFAQDLVGDPTFNLPGTQANGTPQWVRASVRYDGNDQSGAFFETIECIDGAQYGFPAAHYLLRRHAGAGLSNPRGVSNFEFLQDVEALLVWFSPLPQELVLSCPSPQGSGEF